ncbi:hypothetical protein FF011L_18280 [Roseimaritima multifibrata]|uniref:Uncharacterized protein n=1 Tax=Roseimaritima multifibrata TaxID=1930274 RepID=A0A517MDW0_9BACT|nr:hypothetical protein FF011L_18280 [Roseimaritima multifibrata]
MPSTFLAERREPSGNPPRKRQCICRIGLRRSARKTARRGQRKSHGRIAAGQSLWLQFFVVHAVRFGFGRTSAFNGFA